MEGTLDFRWLCPVWKDGIRTHVLMEETPHTAGLSNLLSLFFQTMFVVLTDTVFTQSYVIFIFSSLFSRLNKEKQPVLAEHTLFCFVI